MESRHRATGSLRGTLPQHLDDFASLYKRGDLPRDMNSSATILFDYRESERYEEDM